MKKIFRKFLFLTFFLSSFLLWGKAEAATWYVDNAAAGSNSGTSWTNAWQALSNIQWASVQSGDTIYISGGETSKTYSERLSIEKSGSAGNLITIQVGQDSGHNGTVILNGTSAGAYNGMSLSGINYVKVSGQVGSGTEQKIKIQNFQLNGIYISGSSSNLEVAYVEVTQNDQVAGAAYGLRLDASELAAGVLAEIHHCKFHNNNYADEVYMGQSYQGTRITYDQIKFHDNEVYDAHADFIKSAAEGTSIYNNIIHSRGTYMSDHPDGIQGWGGYLKIYNNTFYGFHRTDDSNVNSYIRYNPDGNTGNNGNPQYVWIYNNLFYETLPLTFTSGVNVRRGVELSFTDSTLSSANHIYFMNNTMIGTNYFGLFLGFNSTRITANVSDIIVANNLFEDCAMPFGDYGSNTVVSLGNGGDGSITYGKWGDSTDVIFDYNAVYASSTDFTTNSTWSGTNYTWSNFTTTSGTNTHPANSAQDPQIDLDYTPTASSPYKDAGVDLSAYFTTDKNNITRTDWSIGAYEYVGTGDTVAPAAPSGLAVQ